MKYKIKQNRNITPKDFVKAHMTKEEIQGMEALQGHFTSIDTKSGLREFSHLIPVFKNDHVLNFFESLEKQLSEFGDIDDLHKAKYHVAKKKLPPYVETATEHTLKKLGRGKDKHMVLLPKAIAQFFMKINKENNSVNPKTGCLEFGRRGRSHYDSKWGKIEITQGTPYRTVGAPSGHEWGHHDSGGGNTGYSVIDSATGRPHRMWANGNHLLEPSGVPGALPGVLVDKQSSLYKLWDGSNWQHSTNPYHWGGSPPAPAPAPAAAPSKPSTLATALQYGGTILGSLLGGPVGGVAAGLLGSAVTGNFNASTPTRTATELAKIGFGKNPIAAFLIDKIGNKIANHIPLNPQQALSQHLAGNLNYGIPDSNSEGKIHHRGEGNRNEMYGMEGESPSDLTTQLFEKLRPKRLTGGVPNSQELKERISLRPQTNPTHKHISTDPFARSLEKIKQKELETKERQKNINSLEQEILPQVQTQASSSVKPKIFNNANAPVLTNPQKEMAIQQYAEKNPTNKNNPFEAREEASEMQKTAYRDYYKSHAREINPLIAGG